MAKTKAQFRNILLQYLRASDAAQTPSAADAADAETAIETTHAFLEQKEIAWWSLTAIPDEAVDALKRYVAAELAHRFVLPEEVALYAAEKPGALMDLRSLKAPAREREPVRPTYF